MPVSVLVAVWAKTHGAARSNAARVESGRAGIRIISSCGRENEPI
jgi:hypothetical protein